MDLQLCHICSSSNLNRYMNVKSYNITQCIDCSHIQVTPIPDEKTLLALYKDNNDDSFYGNSCSVSLLERSYIEKDFLIRYYSERIDTINQYISNKVAKILDFGCTNGIFVKTIIESGFKNAFGYDVAESLVEEGRRNGLNLYTGNISKFSSLFKDSFDFILSYHVFEHLPAPKETLNELYKCLKNGGYVYVNVPHINSLQVKIMKEKSPIIDPPFHLHYFTKKSLIRLFEDQGFEIVKVATPFWEKSTDTYLELKGFRHSTAVLLRHLVAPVRGIINLLFLGGNITILARKNMS